MEKKGLIKPFQDLKTKGKKVVRQAATWWRSRWVAWVSFGLMALVTFGGLFYLASDWSPYRKNTQDNFYWGEQLPTDQDDIEEVPPISDFVVEQSATLPVPVVKSETGAPPLPSVTVFEGEDEGDYGSEADPGPEPEIALAPVMAPAQAFAFVERPVEAEVASAFGWRKHPVFNDWRFHPGVDFDTTLGQEVAAAMAGTVISVKADDVLGNTVILDHEGQRSSTYAHLDQVDVEVGQAVDPGQRIGTVGGSGISNEPHLHFELRLEGEAIDPVLYLPSVEVMQTTSPIDN